MGEKESWGDRILADWRSEPGFPADPIQAALRLIFGIRPLPGRETLKDLIASMTPIERALVAGFILDAGCWQHMEVYIRSGEKFLNLATMQCECSARHAKEDGLLVIHPQEPIAGWRADFMMSFQAAGRREAKFVVECDGHDFHERTKEQAKHDRRRDREMQILGYTVLRYTGSEIWESPRTCSRAAVQAAIDISQPRATG